MNRLFIVIILFSLIRTELLCQQSAPIRTWISYLPQHQGKRVCRTSDRIVYASEWGLISIDPDDLSADFISKTNGLSDIGIQNIKYDEYNDQLFVLYENSNIDILRDGKTINVTNIKSNSAITVEKRLFDIFFLDAQSSYISAGFGLVQFNPQSLLFGSTTFTGVKVNQTQAFGDYLYAFSEEGAYRVNLSSQINFNDFSQWALMNETNGLPSLYRAVAGLAYDGKFYLATENALYRSEDGEQFTKLFENTDPSLEIVFINNSQVGLILGLKGNIFSRIAALDMDGTVLELEDSCPARVNDAVVDEFGRVWYADDFNDIKYSEAFGDPCQRLNYDSPYFNGVGEIYTSDNRIFVASGGVSENFNYLFSREGFYVLKDNRWNNFNEVLDPRVGALDLLSIHRIVAHPNGNKLYTGSYWAGLAEYDLIQDEFTLFNQDNSSIRGAVGDESRERVSALAFDENENLWVAAYGAPEPLNVYSSEGAWYSFNVGSQTSIIDLAIDAFGYIWAPVYGNAGGMLVYDPGDNLESQQDDRLKFLNRSNSELTTNTVNVVEIDRDGAVWAGTAEGPVIFDCGQDVFDADCAGVRRKVLEDSIVAFLLADQDILAIAFDGANRKWLGTRNGIFVQSSDGVDGIAQYNTDNSPLFDNQVISMAYRDSNGEMVIGTNKGLMGFQTATSVPEPIHREDIVLVFPNPVRPDYDGPIAIKGLVADARVKITDVNGNLVFETRALGGTATWAGRDLNNQRVSSGVYLIFSSEEASFDTPDTFVAKVLVMR